MQRDARKASQARAALRQIPIDELIDRARRAGELYTDGTLQVQWFERVRMFAPVTFYGPFRDDPHTKIRQT